MFVTEDLQEASRDAQRALEQERDRCVDRIAELDGYLKLLECINDLRSENERLKEELEQQRAENEEIRQQLDDKDIKLKELGKLSVNMAKKSSQEGLEKAFSIYINTSKRKTQAKREVAKVQLLDFITTAKLEMPEDIMEQLNCLDDVQPEAKVVNVSGNYNDIHDNKTVNG